MSSLLAPQACNVSKLQVVLDPRNLLAAFLLPLALATNATLSEKAARHFEVLCAANE